MPASIYGGSSDPEAILDGGCSIVRGGELLGGSQQRAAHCTHGGRCMFSERCLFASASSVLGVARLSCGSLVSVVEPGR